MRFEKGKGVFLFGVLPSKYSGRAAEMRRGKMGVPRHNLG
jgi:hypothetical protein